MPPTILKVLTARRGLSVFLASVVCLAVWQVWLTWRLMDQDRNLDAQRTREHVVQVADLAVAQLAASLGEWERELRKLEALPPSEKFLEQAPAGSTFVLMSQSSVKVYPERPLLFVPMVTLRPNLGASAFDAIDAMELRDQSYDRAIAALEPLAREPDTRPEALLRIARIERKANRKLASLATYKSLGQEDAVDASGTPFAVLALMERCRILGELGKGPEAYSESESLRKGLLEGRWPLRRDAFEYYWSQLDGLGIAAGQPPAASIDFANLVSDIYSQWQTAQSQVASSGGRRLLPDSSLLLWTSTSQRLGALTAPPGWLDSILKLSGSAGDVQWKLLTARSSATHQFSAVRSLADAQLADRIEFFSLPPLSSTTSSRRTLWFVGAALMVAVVLGSGFVLQRALRRELQVARLQSDFVAAVSHEFRSPLTTLRTITELLAQDRIPDEARRRQSYVFLEHETIRLHRLVEDLLDFGRMESGRKQFHFENHDAFELVRAAVEDISDYAATKGFHVEARLGPSPATIRADEEAFRRAVRNLLENAMKYSPDSRKVWIVGEVGGQRVSVSVRDEGMGIDVTEQKAIFQRFVRGDAAKIAGIKGTGIGLAMVRQITEAMGGEISLQSEVGVGSTFTIVVPRVQD